MPRNIELIKWLDPHSDISWAKGDNNQMPSVCWSVGLVITDGETHIVLAADWSDDETNTRLVFPKGAIISRHIIYSIED